MVLTFAMDILIFKYVRNLWISVKFICDVCIF